MAKQRSFFQSLRGKLSVQMLVVALIPLVVVGVLSYYIMSDSKQEVGDSVGETRTAMQDNVVAQNLLIQAKSQAKNTYDDVNDFITEAMGIAVTPAIQNLAAGNEPADAVVVTRYLKSRLAFSDLLIELTVLDAKGNVLATANKEGFPASAIGNQKNEDYFAGALYYLAVSAPKYTEDGDSLVTFGFAIPNPLYESDPQNQPRNIGVLRCPLLSSLFGDAKGAAQDMPGVRVLGYKIEVETEIVKLSNDTADPLRVAREAVLPAEQRTRSPLEQKVIDEIMAADSAAIEKANGNPANIVFQTISGFILDEESGQLAAYYRPTAQSGDLSGFLAKRNPLTRGDAIIYQQPIETAFAALGSLDTLEDDLQDNTNSMLLILIIVLVVVAIAAPVVAFWMSRGITRPVAQLRDVAEKVSMGDMNVNVDVKSNDEIGDLADSFGRMVAAVRFLSQDEEK
ncbi:MAG: HAMP domain-containing protein [Chloroflexi bacterium]|nr:HAMP domain-containing protein [Chloroflexota bacterium]